jgi:hypothetical protein
VIDQIRKRLQNGFEPFALGLTDGRRYEIPARDFIALSQRRVAVIDRDGLVVSINPLHIVSVDDVAPVQS